MLSHTSLLLLRVISLEKLTFDLELKEQVVSELGKENLGEGIVHARSRIDEDIFCSRNVLCGEVKRDGGRCVWMVSRVKTSQAVLYFSVRQKKKKFYEQTVGNNRAQFFS